MTTTTPSLPLFWTIDTTGVEGVRLTYAVRGGVKQLALVAFGAALLLGGLYGVYWLMAGGGLTAAGYVFLLVPGGVALFGVYVLDIALLARTTYLLGSVLFVWTRHSIFGEKSLEIPRGSVKAITQQYSPPGPSAPTGAPGDWTTFVSYHDTSTGKPNDFALDGLKTPEEAVWLGPLLAGWGGVELRRGFGPAFAEADPAELPAIAGDAARLD